MGEIGTTNTLSNWLQLLGVLLIFILILVAANFVTRWLGTSGIVRPRTRNISVIESFRIGPNKYIQIITIGKRYFALGISKDQITYITEIEEDQINLEVPEMKPPIDFKDVLKKVIRKE